MSRFQVGQEISFVSMGTITPELLKEFSITGSDPNPIHLDDRAAQKAGLTGPIAHGMLLATLIIARIEKELNANENLAQTHFRFRAMTFLGEEVFVGGKVLKISPHQTEFELVARSQKAAEFEIKTLAKIKVSHP